MKYFFLIALLFGCEEPRDSQCKNKAMQFNQSTAPDMIECHRDSRIVIKGNIIICECQQQTSSKINDQFLLYPSFYY